MRVGRLEKLGPGLRRHCWLLLLALCAPLIEARPGGARAASHAPPDAGEQSRLRSIESLSNPLGQEPAGPVVLRGVVTLVRSRVVYVQDQTGAIAVFPVEPARLAIGDEVEMHGEYRGRNPRSALYNATLRRLWSGSPPVPLALKPEQAAEGSFEDRLIDTEGRLLRKTVTGGYLRLTLEGDRQIFGASLELSWGVTGDSPLGAGLEEGSTLRLVGVCVPSASPEESGGNAFQVLLRSTDDIRIVNPAPWWNVRHAIWVGLAALILLSLFYRIRNRAMKLRFRAIVEERSRMAREMHDTLAQGFSGLTYQLEGLARELDASVDRNAIERHLAMALRLLHHCREDAHRSIFALRSLAQTDPDLLTSLLGSCDGMRQSAGVRISGFREGRPLPMRDEEINHLLRIGQEAITNALQHSGATEISVTVRYGDAEVVLEVSDNGRGFDVKTAKSVDAGHFGIMGMRERARHMHASLTISSTAGAGTIVTVRVLAGKKKKTRWIEAIARRSGAPQRSEPAGSAGSAI